MWVGWRVGPGAQKGSFDFKGKSVEHLKRVCTLQVDMTARKTFHRNIHIIIS